MPISDCEVRDPRMRRTRQSLQKALRKLMAQRSLEEISVSDIADLADVNRATFYDHYTDKFSLLEGMVSSGFHTMLHERQVRYDGSCPSAARAIILAVADYLQSEAFPGSPCSKQNAFEPLMESAITSAIRRVLIEGIQHTHPGKNDNPSMVATTAAWAIYGAVKDWFYSEGRASADEAVPQILKLVVPILEPMHEIVSVHSFHSTHPALQS